MKKIKELADLTGISSSYLDKTGEIHYTTVEIRQYFLWSMGFDIESAETVEKQISRLRQKQILPDVISFYDNEEIILHLEAEGSFDVSLVNEEGKAVWQKNVAGLSNVKISGIVTGYYEVVVRENAKIRHSSLLIYAPCLAYQPPFLKNREHIFGVSVML